MKEGTEKKKPKLLNKNESVRRMVYDLVITFITSFVVFLIIWQIIKMIGFVISPLIYTAICMLLFLVEMSIVSRFRMLHYIRREK